MGLLLTPEFLERRADCAALDRALESAGERSRTSDALARQAMEMVLLHLDRMDATDEQRADVARIIRRTVDQAVAVRAGR